MKTTPNPSTKTLHAELKKILSGHADYTEYYDAAITPELAEYDYDGCIAKLESLIAQELENQMIAYQEELRKDSL